MFHPSVANKMDYRCHGEYFSKTAYEIQFLGSIASNMNKMVCKAWAPLKVKFFTWLPT
jgi:hypothetical protein